MGEERFVKIVNKGLHLAVGLRFPMAEAPGELPGLVKYQAPAGAKFQNFYWPAGAFRDLANIELVVPPEGEKAEQAELRFRRQAGYRILFGRHGEEQPFGFNWGDYVTLRLDPVGREGGLCKDFNPLYIRVDHGAEVYFYVLRAGWKDGKITIMVQKLEETCEEIPLFLVCLPEFLAAEENLRLE